MNTIQLSSGLVAVVDDADHEWLSQWKWWTTKGYAVRQVRRGGTLQTILMHRLIAEAKPGEEVDHISGDKLDNRRANLRLGTHGLNMQNLRTPKPRHESFSVERDKKSGRWRVRVWVAGKRVAFGYYDTAEQAAEVARVKRAELMPFSPEALL